MEKMIGIVTLYNPDKKQALDNMKRYAPFLNELIVWDNSSVSHEDWFTEPCEWLAESCISYHWTGENACIAPAVNYVWKKAVENNYDYFLIMDQDSTWVDFKSYREDIERKKANGEMCVCTPYVNGCDTFDIKCEEQEKRLFINSGAVIPTRLYTSIGPRNEDAYPLDAFDHDIAYALIENGYKAICLTRHKLNHSIGQLKRGRIFNLLTPDYNAFRTYHMTRSHIICYRMHKKSMTADEIDFFYKEYIIKKFLRIILLETEKFQRMKAFFKGFISGIRYKIK